MPIPVAIGLCLMIGSSLEPHGVEEEQFTEERGYLLF